MYFHKSNSMKGKLVRLARQLLLTSSKETDSKWWHDLPQFTHLKTSWVWLSDFYAYPFLCVIYSIPPKLPPPFLRLIIPSNIPYTTVFQTLYHLRQPTCHYIFVKNKRTPFQKDVTFSQKNEPLLLTSAQILSNSFFFVES